MTLSLKICVLTFIGSLFSPPPESFSPVSLSKKRERNSEITLDSVTKKLDLREYIPEVIVGNNSGECGSGWQGGSHHWVQVEY